MTLDIGRWTLDRYGRDSRKSNRPCQQDSLGGGRALLIGGCVRDILLEKQPKDWDLEVYGIDPERLREILDRFGSVNVAGEKAFTVYKLGLIWMSQSHAESESQVAVIAHL